MTTRMRCLIFPIERSEGHKAQRLFNFDFWLRTGHSRKWTPRKSKPLLALTTCVLPGCSFKPSRPSICSTCFITFFPLRHNSITKSSQYLTNVPEIPDCWTILSNACRYILLSNGEIQPPCGVPNPSGSIYSPSSITPASSHPRISFITRGSLIRLWSNFSKMSCRILLKEPTTHYPPQWFSTKS